MKMSWGSDLPLAVQKTHRALLPLFVALVCFCYLDRTSLAYAALQLCEQPWFNARVYGLGSGVFYAGYVTFQIPSNILLARLGPRVWLPSITAAWGLVSMCTAALHEPTSFYVLRLFLGITEAGAFPAMWYICGQFYPDAYITMPYSVIEAAIATSQILAAPTAAVLLQLAGVARLAGWQWLFLAQGGGTLVLAGVLAAYLPDSLASASFLGPSDKQWLAQQLATRQSASSTSTAHELMSHTASAAVTSGRRHPGAGLEGPAGEEPLLGPVHTSSHLNPAIAGMGPGKSLMGSAAAAAAADCDSPVAPLRAGALEEQLTPLVAILAVLRCRWIWYLMVLKMLKDISLDALVYWVPTLVHSLVDGGAVSLSANPKDAGSKSCGSAATQLTAILLSAIPFGLAAVTALVLGHSSEVHQERSKHIGLPMLAGGVAFLLMPAMLLAGSLPAFISVVVCVVAADATTGPFWTWVHLAAPPGAGAVTLAAVNSVGKAGGFLGPLSFGVMKHSTGSYLPSILFVGTTLLVGGALALAYAGPNHRGAAYSELSSSGAQEDAEHGLSQGSGGRHVELTGRGSN